MKLARPVGDGCWRTLGAPGEGCKLRARSIHEDTDDDGDVDASDKWFHHAFDERWRWVATFREDDTDPKEEFLHHAAGLDGRGTGSYIDLVVLRDRDINSGWTSAADGTLEERIYYCQNWRADVSALVTDAGQMLEWVKYSAYGVPFGLPGGDANSDGDCDGSDLTQVSTWVEMGPDDVRGDVDLDGDVDETDSSTISSSYQGITLGRGVLSANGVHSKRGYAGYILTPTTSSLYCIRHRTLNGGVGVWTSRDPIQEPTHELYAYCNTSPLTSTDPMGLEPTTQIECDLCEIIRHELTFTHTTIETGILISGARKHKKAMKKYIRNEGLNIIKAHAELQFDCKGCPGGDPCPNKEAVPLASSDFFCTSTVGTVGEIRIADIPIPVPNVDLQAIRPVPFVKEDGTHTVRGAVDWTCYVLYEAGACCWGCP